MKPVTWEARMLDARALRFRRRSRPTRAWCAVVGMILALMGGAGALYMLCDLLAPAFRFIVTLGY